MKIVFIGCVEFSRQALELVQALPGVSVVGVITQRHSPINADFHCLAPLAESIGCPAHFADGNDQDAMAAFIGATGADVVYCFGWSYLLKPRILSSTPLGVVGYHPAALPQNRGRHPIIWALALGLPQTGSTFFFMTEGADDGDIISQDSIVIDDQDDAASLYRKVCETALRQIPIFTADLVGNRVTRIKQDHAKANTWRKRGRQDGQIDWRMSAQAIRDLVRALTRPYVGAHLTFQGQDIKVWRCEVGPAAPTNLEPGRVLMIDDNNVTVKCLGGSVILTHHDFDRLPAVGTFL